MKLSLLYPLRFFLGLLTLFLLWQAWVFLRPRPRTYSLAEIEAVRAVYRAARAGLEAVPIPARVGVTHLANDPADILTALLREELALQRGWTIEETSVIRKFLGDVTRAVADATSLDEILRAGRRVELDLIVLGRVESVTHSNDTARAELQLHVYDVRSGEWALRDILSAEWRPTRASQAAGQLRALRPLTKSILWVLWVLALPWITYPATHWVLERRSNAASFGLLLFYVISGLAAGLLLSGWTVSGGKQWLRFLAAALFSAAYSFRACERIAGKNKCRS